MKLKGLLDLLKNTGDRTDPDGLHYTLQHVHAEVLFHEVILKYIYKLAME